MRQSERTAVVILPAYRPDQNLIDLANQLWIRGMELLVVDDGSGQEYQKIFDRIRDIAVILHHTENRGKGAAIKTALGYLKKELWDADVVGVMDVDGQHQVSDLERILRRARVNRNTLILGVRQVGRKMPLKSRIGNWVTREIFRKMTGKRISDTQTGLRAFGVELTDRLLEVPGERYEYETNVLVEMVKVGIKIQEEQIETIYRDEKNSTSHFRVIADSFRIYKDLLKFTASSLSSFLLDYLMFLVFTAVLPHTAFYLATANVTARGISAFYNYMMNSKVVFHKGCKWKTAAEYLGLAVLILCANNLILESFVWGICLPLWLAKILTESLMFLLSWGIQSRFIFRKDVAVRI